MGADRTGGVETVEDAQPADRPPPPPPPDQPGAEPEGVPSRADSRAAATAANRPEAAQPVEETRDEQAPSVAEEEQDSSAEPYDSVNEPAAPATETSGNQEFATDLDSTSDEPAADIADPAEDPPGRDDPTAPPDALSADVTFGGGPEQRPDTLATPPTDDPPVHDARAPETADHLAPPDRDATAGAEQAADDDDATLETAGTAQTEDPPTFDDPGGEPEQALSGPDTPAVTNDQATDTSPAESDTSPAAETIEPHTTTDDWPWADEFAARAQARETAAAANAEQTDEPPATDPAAEAHRETTDTTPATPTVDEAHEDAHEPRSEDGSGTTDPLESATGTPDEEDRPDLEFVVGHKLVRVPADLDPVRAQDRSSELGDQQPDPTDRAGDRIVQPENDKDTRAERFRKKTYEVSEDVLDAVQKGSNRAQDLFPPRPPTGHPETRTAPVAIPGQQHDAISAGDTATALMAAGVVMVEFYRWGRGKLAKEKGE